MHDVMISYSCKDQLVADAICSFLEKDRIRVWIAPRDMLGRTYPEAIIEGIKNSLIIVLVFSSNANGSAWVPKEIERGVHYEKIIIPFKIEEVNPISADFELCTSTYHWLDAITPPLERNIIRLVQTVSRLLEKEQCPENGLLKKKYKTLTPLGELYQLAGKWAQNDYAYFVLESLGNELKSMLRNTPKSIEIEDEELLLFMMVASLHYGGNWEYWQKRISDPNKIAEQLVSVLEVSYLRPKLRALYAIQLLEPSLFAEKLAGTTLIKDNNLLSIIQNFVFTRQVFSYLETLLKNSDQDVAKKAKVVLDEIKRYQNEHGTTSTSILPEI